MQPVTGQYDDVESDVDTEDTDLAEIHEIGMERYHAAKEAWAPIHADYVRDLEFADGEQWDPEVAEKRKAAGLSTLVYNQITAKRKYVVNNIRRALPGVKVTALRNGATQSTAKVIDGLIRATSNRSEAKAAYINAIDCAVTGGLGAWRVQLEDTDGDGVTDIVLERILDPTRVLYDPAAIKQDFSDAEYVFLESVMSRSAHDRKYGADNATDAQDVSTEMFDKEAVVVLEYWCKDPGTKVVTQYIMNCYKIVDVNDNYLGEFLPIMLLTGEERHIRGKRKYRGIVHGCIDMQMVINLAKSKTADYLARSNDAPWVVSAAQIEGYEEIWFGSNINGAPVLPYKETPAGKPSREESPAPPTGFQAISAEADQDMRNAVGIRDALEKLPANIATKTMEMAVSQSNIGTLDYSDRLKDLVRHCGKVVYDLIRKHITEPQQREIMGPDGKMQTVMLNQAYLDDNGQPVKHDLGAGKYEILIQDGPSYESQRSEAADKLMECAKVYPQFMSLAGDIVFRNMDFEGASEIADRLHAMLPPAVQAISSAAGGDGANKVQMLQSQMQQMSNQMNQLGQQNQQLHQFLQQAQQEQATKAHEIQVKTQAEIELENVKHAHALELERVRQGSKTEQIQAKGAIDHGIQSQHDDSTLQRDILKNHTEIFRAELEHNARNPTVLDDVPVIDPTAIADSIVAVMEASAAPTIETTTQEII